MSCDETHADVDSYWLHNVSSVPLNLGKQAVAKTLSMIRDHFLRFPIRSSPFEAAIHRILSSEAPPLPTTSSPLIASLQQHLLSDGHDDPPIHSFALGTGRCPVGSVPGHSWGREGVRLYVLPQRRGGGRDLLLHHSRCPYPRGRRQDARPAGLRQGSCDTSGRVGSGRQVLSRRPHTSTTDRMDCTC